MTNQAQSTRYNLGITVAAFRQAWDRLRKRAGLNDLTFHDLRHGQFRASLKVELEYRGDGHWRVICPLPHIQNSYSL